MFSLLVIKFNKVVFLTKNKINISNKKISDFYINQIRFSTNVNDHGAALR